MRSLNAVSITFEIFYLKSCWNFRWPAKIGWRGGFDGNVTESCGCPGMVALRTKERVKFEASS